MAKNKVEITGINTSKLKVLKHEEMTLLFKRYQSGDKQAKEKLINGNLKLVLSILRKYQNRVDNMDDFDKNAHAYAMSEEELIDYRGVTTDNKNIVYLRPENAQGEYVNFLNVQRTTRSKLPFFNRSHQEI